MATVTTYNNLSMEQAGVWYGDVTIASYDHIQISNGFFTQNYYGSFIYDYYGLAGGTVTASNFYENASKIWEISGGSWSALTVESYIDAGDGYGLQAYILSGADRLNGSRHHDILLGHAGNDQIFGNSGDDIVWGGLGNDHIDGGSGTDTAVYAGDRALYSISNINGAHGVSGGEGLDTLVGVERLAFNDKYVALDIDGTAGQVYRLYRAAFNRAPDEAGLGYWVGEMDGGHSLLQIAHGFLRSEEFMSRYGSNVTNDTYVRALYENLLGRGFDQSGFDYWVAELAAGTNTREGVLIGFSESVENKLNVIGMIQGGIEYIQA